MTFDRTLNLSILASLLVFLLGQLIAFISGKVKERRARKKLLLALYVEVQLNVEALVSGILTLPSFHAISQFMADKNGRPPLFVFTFSDLVFRSNTALLSDLHSVLIKNIVDFYGSLAYISQLVSAMDRPSFRIISPEGRDRMVLNLKEQLELTRQKGNSLLGAFTLILPKGRIGSSD